jgi:PTS system nitrogen regulatory IIA component
MNILSFTRNRDAHLTQLAVKTQEEAFKVIIDNLCDDAFFKMNPALTKAEILEALVAREAQRTTAVGSGIAFPHARMEHLHRPAMAIATLKEPVLFDTEPVQFICLILVPQTDATISLKLMAQMTKILRDEQTRNRVHAAHSSEELHAIFKTHNPRVDKPLLASDIMRAPRWHLAPDDPVSKCSHMMGVNGLSAIPVISDTKQILGEITVEKLFRYGLPDFFSNLKSVSFIAEFDPFEKYFADERNIPVGTIMERDTLQVPLDYTIMEIVFDLAVRKRSAIYVVDKNNKWVGIIDKAIVLDNVINY